MPFEKTSVRLWKRLTPEERLAAATHFWSEPPQELLGTAIAALVKARHMRPQAARTLPPETKARILALVLDPGEPLAASLLVALHLGERRPILSTFLDALGLPHEDGILKEGGANAPPPAEDKVRSGVQALAGRFPRPHVETYLNTLWLQDPEHWALLTRCEEWL